MTDRWWDTPAVLNAAHNGDTATVIRLARQARGETQRQTGKACGYSQSEISRIESGKTQAYDIRLLGLLAQHLAIPPHLLGLAPSSAEPPELPVNRRQFLAGTAAVATAAALTPRDGHLLDGLTRELDSYQHLFNPTQRPTLDEVQHRVVAAHALYQGGDYDTLSNILPQIIGATNVLASTANGDDQQRVLTAQVWTYIAAAKLATKFAVASTARLAADRAVAVAAYTGSPVLLGAAAYQLTCAFNCGNELDKAQEVASGASAQLARNPDQHNRCLTSVRGALFLISAIVAARQHDTTTSVQQLNEAQRMADVLGEDGNFAWTAFGRTNVRTHALAVAVSVGEADTAVRIGQSIEPRRFPDGLLGRRCEVYLDTAWAYTQRRDDAEAVDQLLAAERIAPQIVRSSVKAQNLVDQLLARERRSATPGLRQLSSRLVTLPS